MKNTQNKKCSQLGTIFKTIDSNLCKFYSSRPSVSNRNGKCPCKFEQMQKQEQISFYSSQRQLINQAVQILTQQDRDQNQRIVGKILGMAVQYINTILMYVNKDYLCQCKQAQITQSLVIRHKLNFMREQNDKFFKLVEQKNAQCERLQKQIKQLQNRQKIDVIPLSTKAKHINQSSIQNKFSKNQQSFQFSQQKSLKSSNISDIDVITKVEVKQTTQKDHNFYFIHGQTKKQKKSKIFADNSVLKQNSRYFKS